MPKPTVDYNGLIWRATFEPKVRLVIGIPMTGLVRSEWMMGRYQQAIPCNWSQSECLTWMNTFAPLNFAVAEARNICVHEAIQREAEWLLFIDHDTILPTTAFVQLNTYMQDGTIPVVCGLYYAKCHPPEPLIFRGRGNGCFTKFTIGEKVWCDGIPMGCTLISMKLMKLMYDDAPKYQVGERFVKRVFDTPYGIHDNGKGGIGVFGGTEDLAWCARVIGGGYLKKAGFPAIAAKKYPFLCDTNIFCKHITPDGRQYPLGNPNAPKAKRHG